MRLAGIFLILMPFFAEAKKPLQELNPIDQYFESYWKAEKIKPAPLTDDYEYLRRVTLDLGGRLPTPDEVRAFRANRDRDKRAKQIEQLIKEESSVQFWADQWLRILFQYRFSETDPIKVYFPSFVGWLKDSFQNDLPYNQFVTQLIADRGDYRVKNAERRTPSRKKDY